MTNVLCYIVCCVYVLGVAMAIVTGGLEFAAYIVSVLSATPTWKAILGAARCETGVAKDPGVLC